MNRFLRYKENKLYNHLINSIDYHEKRRLKQKDEHDVIQVKLKKYEEKQIERDNVISEPKDSKLINNEIDKISEEEYYQIYLKLKNSYEK